MLESILRWLVAVVVWIISQYEGMWANLYLKEPWPVKTADVMGGPDLLALESIPNVRKEFALMWPVLVYPILFPTFGVDAHLPYCL